MVSKVADRPMPILYSFRRCPYAMRARMAIIRSGFELELREVLLRDRPAHMLAISPKGTVPVLILDEGTVIEESLEIMQHVLDWRLDEQEQEWIARSDSEFKFHLDRYKYASRYDSDACEHRNLAGGYLAGLDAALRKAAFSIALSDALFPFVRQFANHDREWFDIQPWPALQAWLAANLESAEFALCMNKYVAWREGDRPVSFPSSDGL
jgi:glutathione S-transferase